MASVQVVSVQCGGPGAVVPKTKLGEFSNQRNLFTPCAAYNEFFVHSGQFSNSEFLAYIHDDVTIHDEDWLDKLQPLLDSPKVGVIGLGGAASLGHPNLYKRPYSLPQMARAGYVSNQTDWQVHGGHETGSKQVAVVDAFFMAVRTDLLRRAGGWPVKHLTHHCLDLWICCEAAARGYAVWMCGVSCTHHGGGSSTKAAYREAKWLQGGTLEADHQQPHKWLYDEYRNVLPLRTTE